MNECTSFDTQIDDSDLSIKSRSGVTSSSDFAHRIVNPQTKN